MIQTTIGIEGMACEMCEAHINDVIRKNFSVKSAKSDRRKKQCVVVSEQPLDREVVRAAIDAMHRGSVKTTRTHSSKRSRTTIRPAKAHRCISTMRLLWMPRNLT